MSVALLTGSDFKNKVTNMGGWSNVTSVKFCNEAFPSSNTIDLSLNEDGSIKGWIDGTTLKVSSKGEIITTTSTKWMFDYCSKLVSIDLGNLDTTNVSDASFMFENCSSLLELDLSSLVTTNWDWAGYIFTGCSSLTKVNLSNWDLSRVGDIDYIFQNCSQLQTIIVNESWKNSSTITKAAHIFTGCNSLPNWSSSKTSGEYCKYKEDGGYFTKEVSSISRSIAESIQLLKNALDDSKVALQEKEVTPPEDLKFSGIDEEIDKIGN